MALNIRDRAKKATTFAEIMVDREKLDMQELISKYPNGVVIRDYEEISMANEDGEVDIFYAFVTEEEPDRFTYGGTVFTNMMEEIEADYTVEAVKEAIKQEGLKVKFANSKTKKGRNVVTVEVI